MEKVDDSGEGSELRITDKINYDTILDAFKVPLALEEVENPASGIILVSDNSGSESKNDYATEIDDP